MPVHRAALTRRRRECDSWYRFQQSAWRQHYCGTATATYVDGVYGGIGGDYDIDRVEVFVALRAHCIVGRHSRRCRHTHCQAHTGEFGGNISLEMATTICNATRRINIPAGETLASVSGLLL
jgi:phage shock protein PspC (stress-responsive transcriptional regulator)